MVDKVDQSHAERFKEIARMMECDEDEARWDQRLRNGAGPKPEPKNLK